MFYWQIKVTKNLKSFRSKKRSIRLLRSTLTKELISVTEAILAIKSISKMAKRVNQLKLMNNKEVKIKASNFILVKEIKRNSAS